MRSGVIGTIVRAILCLVLVPGGVFIILAGESGFALYRDLKAYEAARMPVDLSRTGDYRGTFKRRYIAEHGEQLRIVVDPGFESREKMLAALKGIQGRLLISRTTGETIHEQEVTLESFSEAGFPGCGGHAEMAPHTPFLTCEPERTFKACALVLTVDSPAAGMEGRKQELVSKCVYCRTAKGFRALLDWALIIAGVVSAIVGILCGWGFIKRLRGRHGQDERGRDEGPAGVQAC